MSDDPRKFENDVLHRLSNLEKHILNLIFPIQEINEMFRSPHQINQFIEAVSKPILIDDRSFKSSVSEIRSLTSSFESTIEECDLSNFTGELKYISNRLKEIQERLDVVEDMLKLRAIKVYVDGKEMVPNSDMIYKERKTPKRKKRR